MTGNDAVSPHALHRECLATDQIAIRIMTKEEYEKWHLIVAGSNNSGGNVKSYTESEQKRNGAKDD